MAAAPVAAHKEMTSPGHTDLLLLAYLSLLDNVLKSGVHIDKISLAWKDTFMFMAFPQNSSMSYGRLQTDFSAANNQGKKSPAGSLYKRIP